MLCLIWYIVIFFFATDFLLHPFIDQHVAKLHNTSLYDTFYSFDSDPIINIHPGERRQATILSPLSSVFLFDYAPSSSDRLRPRSPPYAPPSLSPSMPLSIPFAFGSLDSVVPPHVIAAESITVEPTERHVCSESDDEDFRHDNRHVCVDLESQPSPLDSSDSYQGVLDKRWKTHLSRHDFMDLEGQASSLDSSDSYQSALDKHRRTHPFHHVCQDPESQASPLDSSDSYQGALDKHWRTYPFRHDSAHELDNDCTLYHPILTAYKRVDQKVRPIPGVFPENIKVRRIIPEDPLLSLPPLPISPPDFAPTAKLTAERMDSLKIHANKFLWPEEVKLFQNVFLLNEQSLAFEQSERGTFREDYFSPYIYPVIDHIPWVHRNIPIPPGIRDKVVALLREKIDAGVYEPSQASYRSKWFCVLKKN